MSEDEDSTQADSEFQGLECSGPWKFPEIYSEIRNLRIVSMRIDRITPLGSITAPIRDSFEVFELIRVSSTFLAPPPSAAALLKVGLNCRMGRCFNDK